MYLKFDNFEHAYAQLLDMVLSEGVDRDVRGFKTREISPMLLVTDNPLQNILTNQVRKTNKAFMVAEFLWIITGRKDVALPSFYNSQIARFSDNGKEFAGAYGPKVLSQVEYVVDCFKKDINTRQAVMTIWERSPGYSKDIPCTIAFQFLHRDGKLDMIVNMRSNDLWLGLPYDFYNFTMIQNMMAYTLGLKIGRYSHLAGSLHLYESNYSQANEAACFRGSGASLIKSEVITADELWDLANLEDNMRLHKTYHLGWPATQPWINMGKILENKCVQVHKSSVQSASGGETHG